MYDSWVTLQGWVGNEVDWRQTPSGWVGSFRLGCTPRYRNRSGSWVDGRTSWYTVNCWRQLGENVADSVHLGDAVVVHGRLRMDEWERDEVTTRSAVVEAAIVGHDLNRGRSRFAKSVRVERVDPESDEVLRESNHREEDLGQLDSLGNPIPEAAEESSAA